MKAEGERAAAERERARVEAKKVGEEKESNGRRGLWISELASCSAPPSYIIHTFTPSQHEQLPEMATFEEFKKTERRPPGSGGGGGDHRDRGRSKEARPPPSASSRPLQPQQPTAGGGGLSGEALVSEYVKRHLVPHLKEKAITREQYDKIKEK